MTGGDRRDLIPSAMANSRFSIASVLLSYFLVAGGVALGVLLLV